MGRYREIKGRCGGISSPCSIRRSSFSHSLISTKRWKKVPAYLATWEYGSGRYGGDMAEKGEI